jgi:hypothetical protein
MVMVEVEEQEKKGLKGITSYPERIPLKRECGLKKTHPGPIETSAGGRGRCPYGTVPYPYCELQCLRVVAVEPYSLEPSRIAQDGAETQAISSLSRSFSATRRIWLSLVIRPAPDSLRLRPGGRLGPCRSGECDAL